MEGNYLSRNTHKGESFGFEEHTWGTSWPARNYACSFCKREFKSAQALGGHMNVHRRDRARLRSSLSSWVSHECTTTPKTNPSCTKANPTHHNSNLSLPSSSSTTSSYLSNALLNCAHRSPLYCPCLTLPSSSLPPASTGGDKKPRLSSFQIPPLSPKSWQININKDLKTGLGVEGLQGCEMEDEHKVLENSNEQHLTLELGIGLFEYPKEKLDLELRLGHF